MALEMPSKLYLKNDVLCNIWSFVWCEAFSFSLGLGEQSNVYLRGMCAVMVARLFPVVPPFADKVMFNEVIVNAVDR